MTKHVADRQKGESAHRLERYAEIERQNGAEGSHPAAQALHRRPKDRSDGARVEHFTRIERGHEA
jgi:hypothetical protein